MRNIEDWENEIICCQARITNQVRNFVNNSTNKKRFTKKVEWDLKKIQVLKDTIKIKKDRKEIDNFL